MISAPWRSSALKATPSAPFTVPAATVTAGHSFPLGASVVPGGVNFNVFSRHATRMQLLLLDDAAAAEPSRVIELDPRTHRTYYYWHIFVPALGAGQLYAYRAFGPFDAARGLRFDPSKALLDPYSRAVVVPEAYSRRRSARFGDSGAIGMKSAVVDPAAYD